MVKKGGGVWVNALPVPIKGQQGRYAVDFPIRPGDTLFKYVYHLPYSGSSKLQVKLPYPIRNFAVMHPPSMSFKPSDAQAFTSPGLAQGLRVEQAAGKPVVRAVPAFEISGIGLAGAASLTAMAPGVAAALLATVAGLSVAIPAMFAYNYMVTTIRGITQELDAFSAEYVTALEHKYVDNRSIVDELREALRTNARDQAQREQAFVS